ncbi:MAG: hypothetical protein V4484_16435 [Pseudomonadota bacterium]
MKALLFMLAMLCTGNAAASSAFEQRCEGAMGNTVTVLTQQNGYSIDNSKSFRALTALKVGAPPEATVLGVTHAEGRLSIEHRVVLIKDPFSDNECGAPQIEVELTYPPVIIYVGSEFVPGTCAYQEILAHEMRHLKAYREHLPKVERTVRAALSKRFDNKPLYARAGQVSVSLKREIDDGWMPYMKRELASVEEQQAVIDSAEEYARLSKVCKGEVQSLIGPANRAR